MDRLDKISLWIYINGNLLFINDITCLFLWNCLEKATMFNTKNKIAELKDFSINEEKKNPFNKNNRQICYCQSRKQKIFKNMLCCRGDQVFPYLQQKQLIIVVCFLTFWNKQFFLKCKGKVEINFSRFFQITPYLSYKHLQVKKQENAWNFESKLFKNELVLNNLSLDVSLSKYT